MRSVLKRRVKILIGFFDPFAISWNYKRWKFQTVSRNKMVQVFQRRLVIDKEFPSFPVNILTTSQCPDSAATNFLSFDMVRHMRNHVLGISNVGLIDLCVRFLNLLKSLLVHQQLYCQEMSHFHTSHEVWYSNISPCHLEISEIHE